MNILNTARRNTLILLIGLVFILIIFSALFSASETAVIASSKTKLHQLVQDGNKAAKSLVHLRRNMGRLVSSLLIGGTLVNISASTIATGIMVGMFGEMGVFYATLIMGILIVFFGEVMPKIFAINQPESTALKASGFLKIFSYVIAPISRMTDYCANFIFRALGLKTAGFGDLTNTAEELRGMIDMHVGEDDDVAQERAMLRSILDLGLVDVGEIMTHRKKVHMLDINLGTEKIVNEILDGPYTRVPLWRDDQDNIVGILHAKALFRAIQSVSGDLSQVNIYELAAKPWFIPETTDLLDQLQAFRKRREHFSIVVDEYGSMMGIVTLEDILEEIVGEIVDEHDIEIPGVRTNQDGSVIVMGTVTIRDLNRQFEWNLDDDEAATIAGLVLHETRQIPEAGQVFNIQKFQIEVLKRQRNQLTLLRIAPNKD